MKRIILVRHGKAEDESSEISDFERSLTLKGKVIAGIMAHKLLQKEKSLGAVLSSPAFRALETALIFAKEFGISTDSVIMNSNLYFKMGYRNLPALLSTVDEETETVSLFGHNPSLSEIANILCQEVCISFKIMTWSEIDRNEGKTEYFLKP
jgi:phosphohistidine phosphatase